MSGSSANGLMSLLFGAGGAALGGPAGAAGGAALGSGLSSAIGLGNPAGSTGGGFALPGTIGTPTTAAMTPSLPSYIDPNSIQAVSTGIAPTSQPPDGTNPLAGPMTGDIGRTYLNYLAARNLEAQRQKTAWAPEHSTPVEQMSGQLPLYPAAPFALPQLG